MTHCASSTNDDINHDAMIQKIHTVYNPQPTPSETDHTNNNQLNNRPRARLRCNCSVDQNHWNPGCESQFHSLRLFGMLVQACFVPGDTRPASNWCTFDTVASLCRFGQDRRRLVLRGLDRRGGAGRSWICCRNNRGPWNRLVGYSAFGKMKEKSKDWKKP